ncbi:hypothetical protein ACKKBG_A06945 [Auxenochlorella protothecoides x Auxenochlorella symbiontica]
MSSALTQALRALRVAAPGREVSQDTDSPFARGPSPAPHNPRAPASPTCMAPDCRRNSSTNDEGVTVSPSLEDVSIPPSFLCPVSMEIMSDPVILATGHTYDRPSIQRWLDSGHKTCPVTGTRLRHMELTPNFALRSTIADWAAENGIDLQRTRPSEPAAAPAEPPRQAPQQAAGRQSANILHGHDEIVWALQPAPGGRLFSASADRTIRAWDVASARCLGVLSGHTRPVLALALAGGRLFSGSYDHRIIEWCPESFRALRTLEGHHDAVRALATAPGGRLVSGSYDASVRVWDVEAGACCGVLVGHAGPVRALAVCAGAVFSGSYDASIRAWDVEANRCLGSLEGHTGAVRALATDGARVFSGSDDASIRVWDARSLACLATLCGHADNVRVLAVGGGLLCSGSWDRTVRVWSVDHLTCLQVRVRGGCLGGKFGREVEGGGGVQGGARCSRGAQLRQRLERRGLEGGSLQRARESCLLAG